MMNIYSHCGLYRADKEIDLQGPFAICPVCGHRHPFLQLPLFIVSGASCAGKSTIYPALLGKIEGTVMLESELLWRAGFDKPEEGYRDFFETRLRLCKNIAQSGMPVVLFGAGMGIPENMESCVERRYFSRLYYLALTCEDDVLVDRLQAHPS
jgi:hypothetical protein